MEIGLIDLVFGFIILICLMLAIIPYFADRGKKGSKSKTQKEERK
jgi:hypothetical protein